MNEQEFFQKLREAFAIEADEHFHTISKCLTDLEHASNGEQKGVIELIFREAHSLKGAARAINRVDIEALCQSLESLFAVWKKDPSVANQEHFDLSAQAVEVLAEMLASDTEISVNSEPVASVIESLKQQSTQKIISQSLPGNGREHGNSDIQIEAAEPEARFSAQPVTLTAEPPISSPLPVEEQIPIPKVFQSESAELAHTPASAAMDTPAISGTGAAFRSVKDTIRVSIGELESLYRQTEELSSIKFMIGRHSTDLKRVMDQCLEWIREYRKQRQTVLEQSQYINGRLRDADYYATQYEKLQNFLKWTARQVEGIESAVGKNIEDERGTMYIMESMTDAMMDNAKQLLMLPFSLVTDPLPTMVRKLSRDLGKDIRFQITGEEIRIDKRILEALKDPLLHLLRNSIDHGIEDATTRAKNQKPITGSILLQIRTAPDNRIEVTLEDDGRGIDAAQVKRKAVSEGLLTEDKALKLDDRDALELVYLSGITTSSIITDVSGRGVGLNVVRENILSLGGEIEIETEPGQRTLFRISLPLSLSNARGVLVRSQGKLYVVPLQFVERGISVHRENISYLDGKAVIDYHGRTVAMRRLEEVLHGYNSGKKDERTHAIVLLLRLSSNMLAIEVDEILWEQDVVIKSLPAPISHVRTIAGATLLSNGELVLVLQVADLFDAARGVSAPLRGEQQQLKEQSVQRLLVVDDSITSRVLLHDILVSSGFEVKTAVDGIDALTHLRAEHFDLIVSDVEMPRMNGFELTEAVRKDEKMHETPVILVTGLESQEDRERGFDVGANAYINKSSFDQSNLIDVISRLI